MHLMPLCDNYNVCVCVCVCVPSLAVFVVGAVVVFVVVKWYSDSDDDHGVHKDSSLGQRVQALRQLQVEGSIERW